MTDTMRAIGCRRRTEREWRLLVEEQRVGRESVRTFCQVRGLLERTFKWWRWSLTTRGGRHAGTRACLPATRKPARKGVTTTALVPTAFVELALPARLDSVDAGTGVEVALECGPRVRRVRVGRGFDVATLRQVVSALEGWDGAC